MSHIDSDQATGEYKENFMSQILQILKLCPFLHKGHSGGTKPVNATKVMTDYRCLLMYVWGRGAGKGS